MITFKQFLSEQSQSDLAYMIETNCAAFLEESKRAGLLIRGIKGLATAEAHTITDAHGNELEYTVKQVRTDRQPLDTSAEKSKVLDKWFKDNMGFPARSQGLFAYGAKSEADTKVYGMPCVIFPIGPMEYIWSPYVGDLFVDAAHKIKKDNLEQTAKEFLDNAGYKKTDLDEMLNTRHEVMIRCGSYYAFPIEYKDQLKQALGIK